MSEYAEMKETLIRGWNTWNTRSVLSHVLLPSGFALNLAIKEYYLGSYLKEALIGRQGKDEEAIRPGRRAWDSSYTDLDLQWHTVECTIQSGTDGDDLVLLVTPKSTHRKPPLLVVEAGILWNRPGTLAREGDAIAATLPQGKVLVYATRSGAADPNIVTQTPCFVADLSAPIGVSTGRRRSLEEIRAIIDRGRRQQDLRAAAFGDLAEVYSAIQTCMAWDTIYEPARDRVVSTVSRIWNNIGSGGCVLFCWDNYFAALLAALDNRAVAYSNAIEITREKTEDGFVPNFAAATGSKSRDRSQPPVGSMVVRELYRKFGDRWLLEELFDDLLAWNRWRQKHRDNRGLLSWGTEPVDLVIGAHYEAVGIDTAQGAAFESGMDNSGLFDDVPFNHQIHMLELQDVGLTSLYVMDCRALAEIARILGRHEEADELDRRGRHYSKNLATLWNEQAGIFLDRRSDTGQPSRRLSPTHFYPLICRTATAAQAERMIAEHFYNPNEFWGQWIMPASARNDPAYPDQKYWRGRIWAPMNFLVYLGLRNYKLPQATADLAEKSKALLLKEWLERGHVHENYNADTGEGCDKADSERLYHWGGLLGIPAMIEAGHLGRPEEPLPTAIPRRQSAP